MLGQSGWHSRAEAFIPFILSGDSTDLHNTRTWAQGGLWPSLSMLPMRKLRLRGRESFTQGPETGKWDLSSGLTLRGFSGGSAGKESACNVGDLGSTPELGRSPGEGNSYPLQYFGLENSMDCVVCGGGKESGVIE